MTIIVVGAGVIGANVTRSLALSGEDVVLLDRWAPGSGTTATTFAWTNANRKHEPLYHRLNKAGMEEHVRLAAELPGPRAHFRSGSLHLADPSSEADLLANVRDLQELGYDARWVDNDDAARIAGDLRIPDTTRAIAHFSAEGYVLADVLVRNLIDDAVRHGATFRTGEVVAVRESSSSATVELSDGATVTGRRVVLATGRWTDALAATADLDIPMSTDVSRGSSIVSLIGRVRAAGTDLRCVVLTPSLNLRPGSAGDIVLQALDLNADIDPSLPAPDRDSDIARTFAHRFRTLTAGSGPLPPVDLRIGVRSMPADGRTIAGYGSPGSRVYCLATHSGVTLGPLLGRLAAREIAADVSENVLDPFRPSRFAGTARSDFVVARPTMLGQQ